MAKFQLGFYRFKTTDDDTPEAIEVVKLTDKKVSFHIHTYLGNETDDILPTPHCISDRHINKTIQRNEDGSEFVKAIYFTSYDIYKNKRDIYDSDYDTLLIAVENMRRLEDKEFYYKYESGDKKQVHYTRPPTAISFEIGRFKMSCENDKNDIRITKINNGFVSVDVKFLYRWDRDLTNVKFTRKIFVNEDGDEYIKRLYFAGNGLLNLSPQEIDSDYGFDMFDIISSGLEKLDNVSIEYDKEHYPFNEYD